MMRRGLVCLGVLLAVVVLGLGAGAQEAAEAMPEAAPAEGFDLQEGVFALMVLAIVMGGLIGFEYIQRRKRSM